jgi:hypothetical protein
LAAGAGEEGDEDFGGEPQVEEDGPEEGEHVGFVSQS